jgi:hypothetical protein
MKLHPSSYLIALVALVMLIAGCGGGGSTPPPPPPAAISVAFNPAAPSTLNTGAAASLTAAVSNDSANGGVTWSVKCGSSTCGSFSAATTASGMATTYTTPAAVPSPATVTVTATSVTDTTKSASASITVNQVGPPPVVLLDGNYVYHLAGQDGLGNYYVAGAFTVKNSVIAGGEQDMTDESNPGYYHDSLAASGSSISLANGNIQIVLNTGDPNVGVNGVETLRGTVVSNARTLISEFDAFATATGSLDQQTSVAQPAGGYAFNLGGLDTSANTFVVGGVLNITGAAISVANSVLDYNDSGSVAQAQTFASGTVGAPDAFGRVAFALTPSASSGLPAFNFAGYTTSTNQMQLVETNDTLQGVLGGTALGQGSNTGRFTQASVAGSSYAFEANGSDAFSVNSTFVQMGGAFGLNAGNTVSGAIVLNDLTLNIGSQITSGTYTVDPTGRVTLTVVATSGSFPNPFPFTFQLYLDGNGNALELGVDDTQATSGLSYVQSAPSGDFEGSYALNVYGFADITAAPAWSAAGPVTVASDAFSGNTDYSVQNATNTASGVTSDVPFTGSENSSTGLLTLNGLTAQSQQNGPNVPDPQAQSSFAYYPIDATRVIAIEIDAQQMGLMMLEGVQPN